MQPIEQALIEIRALHEQLTRSPAPEIGPQAFLPFPPGQDPVAFAIEEVSRLKSLVESSRSGPTEAPQPPQPAQPAQPAQSAMIKLSVFLNREEDAYLENLSSTAKFSGGKKLSKTKLIEAMVKAFHNTGLDVRGVKDDAELLNRVSAQLR